MEDQMKNVKDMIVTEAGQLFEHASEQLQDSTVLDQFEAHFIPRFISLTQLAFRVYQATNSLAHQQLRHTFDLIFVCVETLIGGYFNSGLLEPKFRSRGLVAPLRRVMKALDSGQLIAHGTTQRKRGPEVFADIPPVVKGWSQGEIQVLRDAYIQYFDDGKCHPFAFTSVKLLFLSNLTACAADPVLMIAKRQGHKLPRRSMRDIKGMLKEIGLLVD
ncbi:hypothetical protein N7532_008500 [Penicillium argentinense]|uniref:Uncharacterized protein n=1 Tax=Penicillium argentinense TaxID=1131581 RepID=A0A9W9EXR3_9EURO|nr:uncharacterized protein N7532_008500 [Penicillium argentinense]KAJ5089816.1 hypothetical protein N7532_008500 [Penicillium argentinense]